MSPAVAELAHAAGLADIHDKVMEGRRLDRDDGERLFRSGELMTVGALANVVRERKNGDNAYFVAERVRRTLGGTRYTGLGLPPEVNVTISVGVATCPRDATVLDELMELADKALYRAKADGRDMVVLWGAEERQRVRN